MNSIADVRKWLMQFRLVVYTKDKSVDLDLMEEEVREAHETGLMEKKLFQQALLVIRREKGKLEER
ncbi:DUF910 family protein [Salibacterium salarium]|uniref:DUF910 family protein n=1 Tax=Salibacterium salarium TaxID=284579 RepID=A0A3R9Q6H0_9BACI|nr:DUF910 family protein [Salibacterium salarium]